ncbi:hypothetical protein [Gordonia aquimaris]|uniref:Uncharacterized protein n=1 Tax=Gordonia aquimaris TaxID=2984863 RepID=A0A9X3D707_9ACTN|nr:hypothetical protein [Gordonia aquimaris]MCX2966275.1 hypothetical protein [Gordonia aquimaris]
MIRGNQRDDVVLPTAGTATEHALYAELHAARARIASLETALETLNRSLDQLAVSTDRVTDIADRLSRDNDDLRARAARRTMIEWFNAAIAGLAARQQLAFQDSVIRLDDRAAAYHRGQGTAIAERIRSLVVGAETCRRDLSDLSVWIRSEQSDWKQRLVDPTVASPVNPAQPHTRDGWIAEVGTHIHCLDELVALTKRTPGVPAPASLTTKR